MRQRVAIIDYGSGNLNSVAKALHRVAGEDKFEITVTSEALDISLADKIVLPGVGAFGDCMRGLAVLPDMLPVLEEQVLELRKPFLGICVGFQLLFERGMEHGEHRGLGWLPGEVIPLAPATPEHKVPHMGWNNLILTRPHHPLMQGLSNEQHAYFVHSYRAHCAMPEHILAVVEYGGEKIVAAAGRHNILGVQFHPEKSQHTGLKLLENFLHLSHIGEPSLQTLGTEAL
jgi:glutamine amidotransferase